MLRQDRRRFKRGDVDRRRSSRWRTNQIVVWRVHGGRRTRTGLLKERSLDALLLLVNLRDKMEVGSRICISPTLSDRLGCKTAVVRRIENETLRKCELVAEIDS